MALSWNVLKLHDFRMLLSARLLGTMALQAQAVIVGWQIYSLTHSPFMLGLVGLTEAVPAIACAFFAGHVVDVCRPYAVFISCITALACNMLVLFLIAGGVVAPPFGSVVHWIFANVFFSGLARSFLIPASFSLQSRVVARGELPASTAWLTGTFQTGVITGPAIAGLIYGGYGARAAWLIPVSLMCTELVLVCTFSKLHRQYKSSEKHEPALKSIRAGWRFILKSRVLLPVMALDMFSVLFGGAVAMLPAYADRILHVGSEGLGILYSAPAVGAVLGSLALALKPMKHIRGSLLFWVFAGFGFCMIAFAFSTIFWLSLLLLALSGAFDSVNMVIRGSLNQLLTPDAMRGRVASVASMFVISSNEIGAFESGLAASLIGLVPSVALGGVGTLLVVALTALLSPDLRRLKISNEGKLL